MRDLILSRIKEILENSISESNGKTYITGKFNSVIVVPKNAEHRKKILLAGEYYPYDFDFSSLSNDKLLMVFERIVRCYYKQWA